MSSPANNRILCIDDDHGVQEAYSASLSPQQNGLDHSLLSELLGEEELHEGAPEDFELTLCSQGEEGASAVRKSLEQGTPFAVAFIDIRMPPGWDGLKTAQEIRKIDPNINVVFVTAYSDYNSEQIQSSMEHDTFLMKKPFDIDVIRQMAKTLCLRWEKDQQQS